MINGEDALFNLTVIIGAKKFIYIKESIYKYRIRYSSSSKTFNDKFFDSNFIFLKDTEKILKKSMILSLKDIDGLINFSYSYSIYLYIFLVSTIKDKNKQAKELYKLDSNIINEYFNRYKTTNHVRKNVICIYNLVRKGNLRTALMIMKIINNIRNIRNKFSRNDLDYYFLDL